MRKLILALAVAATALTVPAFAQTPERVPGTNPLILDKFTADPAALVVGDTVYLYVGHDEATGDQMFNLTEWMVYSSRDMKTWTDHGVFLKPTDFKWAVRDAWASHMVEKDGKFYFYTTVHHGTISGNAVGVAVSDSPTGPFVDAKGSALITNDMTPDAKRPWEDIDPAVFIDDDGSAYITWGNGDSYFAKLKPNMIELDGPIRKLDLPHYVEGPWIHKRNGLYYLSYPHIDESKGGWEQIGYATSKSIDGPWEYQGLITGEAENSFTIHPSIIEFKGQWYFFYHNAALTIGDQTGAIGRRAVALEYLYYNEDGTIQPIEQTKAGVSLPPRTTGHAGK